MLRIPEKLGAFPEWHEGDGPTPYVWDKKMPPGARCAWSCYWACRQGMVKPDDWMPAEAMDEAQTIAELEDVAEWVNINHHRITGGAVYKQMSEKAAMWLELINTGKSDYHEAHEFLRVSRQSYPEYINPFNPPIKIFQDLQRTGMMELKNG